jgi:GMP synthase-like glutamine amidotransferase
VADALRILVVEHEADAGLGLVGERLHAAQVEVHIVGPDAELDVPTSADGFDGVVVLGGTPGPLEDERAPWLGPTRELLRSTLDAGIPLLGVCLGAQLLAVVAGGDVAEAAAGGEVGLSAVRMTDAAASDPLLHDLPDDLRTLQWHFLEVRELPAGSVPLCTSDRCPNQAFRVGESAWGLQFHLEATTRTAIDWTATGAADLAAVGLTADEVVSDVEAAEDDLRATWSIVADRWIDLVRQSAEARDRAALLS